MRSRWFTTKAVFLVLSISICSANAAPPHNSAAAPEPATPLRFGQVLALSDFDADGLMDEAMLASWGTHRCVEVLLSRSGKPLVLHFDNGSVDRGSLFAQDVDNDGAPDLVWTDLRHAERIVVWRGSDDGEFARVPAALYAGGYTLPDQSINLPDETIRETSIGTPCNCSSEETRHSSSYSLLANHLPQHRLQILSTSSPAFGEPSDRGPPHSIS